MPKILPLHFLLCHGYDLKESGAMDSVLKDRLDFTLELVAEDLASNVIVAGKYSKRDKDFCERTGITESKVMREYLDEKKCPVPICQEPPVNRLVAHKKTFYEKFGGGQYMPNFPFLELAVEASSSYVFLCPENLIDFLGVEIG